MHERLDQRRLPGTSRLYADFLYDSERLAGFFPAGPRSIPALLQRVEALDLDRRFPLELRRRVAGLLAATFAGFDPGPAAAENLDRLTRPGTVVVVAGQQTGLFGGPLLTLYKALTAIRLARELSDAGRPAVPVFWLASQDHDLDEINQAWLLDRDSELCCVEAGVEPAAAGQPVGEIGFGQGIEAALAEWSERAAPAVVPAMSDSQDSPVPAAAAAARAAAAAPADAAARLRAAYHPGATFASSFARLMAEWFAPWGLLLLDPLIRGWEELARPLYLAAFDRAAELRQALARRDRELEARGYHLQVTQAESASLLFLQDGAARRLLRRLPDSGEARRWLFGDEPLAAAELRRRLEERPERVSPAALLRPLLQDSLLPVVCQISGPAETAYLAQSSALSALLGVPAPQPWPRASLTFTDARARRLLSRHRLRLEDLFQSPAADLLARASLDPGLEAALSGLQSNLQSGLEALLQRLENYDPTLLDAARTAAAKIRHQSDQLAARIARSMARRNEELRRHAAHLSNLLFPHRQLQERVLNSAAILARNPEFLERVYAALAPSSPDHLLLPL